MASTLPPLFAYLVYLIALETHVYNYVKKTSTVYAFFFGKGHTRKIRPFCLVRPIFPSKITPDYV